MYHAREFQTIISNKPNIANFLLMYVSSISIFTFLHYVLMRDNGLLWCASVHVPLWILSMLILASGHIDFLDEWCHNNNNPTERREGPSSPTLNKDSNPEQCHYRSCSQIEREETERYCTGRIEWKAKYHVNNWSQGVSFFQPRALSNMKSPLSSLTLPSCHSLSPSYLPFAHALWIAIHTI